MLPDDQPTIPVQQPDGSRSSPSSGWAAPSVEKMQAALPQYEVLGLIGRGGMGAVYKARQKSLKRLVAVKILPLDLADDEFKFAERFQNEALAMARLNRPNIVNVHDAGETADGLLYFVMEFVEGRDLAQEIAQRGRLPEAEAKAIALQVVDALAYAHANGIVHRDIKPANVMLDTRGQVKVADFGLAKMSANVTLTQSSVTMGSPDFIAPEALKQCAAADHRADIFAVGVMLYQMLTGELPRGMFKLPSRLVPGLDERLDAIICKAMEHDPADRYQSAEDMRAALDGLSVAPPRTKSQAGLRAFLYAVAALVVVAVGMLAVEFVNKRDDSQVATAGEPPWQPIFDKPEDFVGRRAVLKDGWAVLADRPLTIGRDMRDGAVRATTRYLKSGVGSLAVRANQNGHQPVIAFISGGGTKVVLEFRPDYSKKETQRRDFELPKPLSEGEEFSMELSARGPEFRVSVNGVEVGRALRDLPGITSGAMGVIPVTGQSVQFKDIAWREFQ